MKYLRTITNYWPASRRFPSRASRYERGSRARRRGAAVVELAVMLPLLFFLFAVAVDFARIFYFSVTLTNCARAGAMYASDPTASAESPFANTTAAARADATNLSPAPTISSVNGTDGNGRPYVEVTAAYTFNTITGFPGVPSQINLTRKVRMNVSAGSPNTN
jgi:Flp pilus assembly protein TadG